jgi:leucyl aminopeptidase
MQIQLHISKLADIEADVLALLGWEGSPDNDLNGATGGWVNDAYSSGEFTGKPCEVAILYRPSGLKARRLVLVGAGKADKFTENDLRKTAGTAVRALKGKSLRNVHFALGEPWAGPSAVQALVEGALLGDYEPDQLKTDPKKTEKRLESFTVCVPQGGTDHESALEKGRILAEAQNFGRDLVNEPANRLTPLLLAEQAKKMAADFGLDCEILDEARMRQIGMGSLLGVAQGSDNPSALIILRYTPENSTGSDHLGLVGKGVTFDTGGISIKPAEGMEKMKYDMGGGASVIGAMRAIAQLKPAVRVTALIPAVENMLSGRAQRPGDIVTALSGKTIEVLNTDAEGRLILVDALTYAIRLGCTHLVDAATLTGAIVVALGHVHIGAFTNNEELLAKVSSAGKAAGDRMWHMPLDDDYKEYLKSAFADLPNIGGRWGGAITAAKFLEEFVEAKPWVHLDIAGTAWLDDAKPHMAKGPTGLPTRTFANLALNWLTEPRPS